MENVIFHPTEVIRDQWMMLCGGLDESYVLVKE